MTATLTDLNIEDRARALVAWASRYDDILTVLTSDRRGYMSADRAVDSLAATAATFAHPLLSASTVNDLFRDLRDACSAKQAWDELGVLPMHLEDRFTGGGYTEAIEEALEQDINDALWPLLTGLSTAHVCRECQRTRPDVTDWQPMTIGSRCDTHRLVLA